MRDAEQRAELIAGLPKLDLEIGDACPSALETRLGQIDTDVAGRTLIGLLLGELQ